MNNLREEEKAMVRCMNWWDDYKTLPLNQIFSNFEKSNDLEQLEHEVVAIVRQKYNDVDDVESVEFQNGSKYDYTKIVVIATGYEYSLVFEFYEDGDIVRTAYDYETNEEIDETEEN